MRSCVSRKHVPPVESSASVIAQKEYKKIMWLLKRQNEHVLKNSVKRSYTVNKNVNNLTKNKNKMTKPFDPVEITGSIRSRELQRFHSLAKQRFRFENGPRNLSDLPPAGRSAAVELSFVFCRSIRRHFTRKLRSRNAVGPPPHLAAKTSGFALGPAR